MLLVLKILLAIASYVSIFFTEKHMWARMLSICTGGSLILWMIIPHIHSKIPKKSDLWQSILLAIGFILVYMLVCYSIALHYEHDDSRYNVLDRVSSIGLVISFVAICFIGATYVAIYESNIVQETKEETNVTSSVVLIAANANNELSGKLESSAQGSYILFAGTTQATLNGTLTTEQIIEYWYYASDGSINPGNVPKKSIKIFFIEDDETPHMDTIVKTTQLIEINYNEIEMKKTTHEKEEVDRTYVFYVPKGSILEQYDFNE